MPTSTRQAAGLRDATHRRADEGIRSYNVERTLVTRMSLRGRLRPWQSVPRARKGAKKPFYRPWRSGKWNIFRRAADSRPYIHIVNARPFM